MYQNHIFNIVNPYKGMKSSPVLFIGESLPQLATRVVSPNSTEVGEETKLTVSCGTSRLVLPKNIILKELVSKQAF